MITGLKRFIPSDIYNLLMLVDCDYLQSLEEIRLRRGEPIFLKSSKGDYFVRKSGELSKDYNNSMICDEYNFNTAISYITESSIYALSKELSAGYITVAGGHRIGVVGKCLMKNGIVVGQRDISSLNYRIAKNVIGAGEKVLSSIIDKKYGSIYNTLVISPPGAGKTTLLRDLARIISNGNDYLPCKNVSLVDERSEIAGSYNGKSHLDVGHCTDILDGFPKSIGMNLMIRSMSPDILVTDEIGAIEDTSALLDCVNCGVKLLVSAHGSNIDDVISRPMMNQLLNNKVFKRYIVLSRNKGVGTVEGIYNQDFNHVRCDV